VGDSKAVRLTGGAVQCWIKGLLRLAGIQAGRPIARERASGPCRVRLTGVGC